MLGSMNAPFADEEMLTAGNPRSSRPDRATLRHGKSGLPAPGGGRKAAHGRASERAVEHNSPDGVVAAAVNDSNAGKGTAQRRARDWTAVVTVTIRNHGWRFGVRAIQVNACT